MRGEVNTIQRGKLGRVSTLLCPLANSIAGHPWVTSLSKGQSPKVSRQSCCSGRGGGPKGTHQAAFAIHYSEAKFSPERANFPLALSAAGPQHKVSCPNVLFILLNKETGSRINIGGPCVLLSGAGSPTRRRLRALPGFQRGV